MTRFYTWAKSVENPSPPSQRNSDVELGHGANKGRTMSEQVEQVTNEKDVMK